MLYTLPDVLLSGVKRNKSGGTDSEEALLKTYKGALLTVHPDRASRNCSTEFERLIVEHVPGAETEAHTEYERYATGRRQSR